jgi:hypothetical protein
MLGTSCCLLYCTHKGRSGLSSQLPAQQGQAAWLPCLAKKKQCTSYACMAWSSCILQGAGATCTKIPTVLYKVTCCQYTWHTHQKNIIQCTRSAQHTCQAMHYKTAANIPKINWQINCVVVTIKLLVKTCIWLLWLLPLPVVQCIYCISWHPTRHLLVGGMEKSVVKTRTVDEREQNLTKYSQLVQTLSGGFLWL